MRANRWLRVISAIVLASGTVRAIGCGDLARQSVKDGLVNFMLGSVSQGMDAALLGDFITNILSQSLGSGGLGGFGTASQTIS